MRITGAQAMVKALEYENTEVMFGYPGAAICPFYDALLDSGIKHILTRHEQGAAHAANGYARATGRTAVCSATSGPGATNLITGIATAYMDSIPLVAITGQVQTWLIGRDVFQEADITGATEPFCKHNYLVKDVRELPKIMKHAFHIASTGRPGPVLIDVPLDIQNEELDFVYPDKVDIRGYNPIYEIDRQQVDRAIELIKNSKRPLIIAGGGIINSNASSQLRQMVHNTGIPVVTTLMGIGSMQWDDVNFLGMLGSHGTYAANFALHNSDLMIIAGARVGNRAMGDPDRLTGKIPVIHIDIDPAEIGKNLGVTVPLTGDIRLYLNEFIKGIKNTDYSEWLKQLNDQRKDHGFIYIASPDSSSIQPRYVLDMLSEMAGENTVISTEVGQNQIWAANHYKFTKPRTFISSGGLGTMGYGLPAAIGAKVGKPDDNVISVSGDGSFQMSLQELGTIKQHNVGVKIIMFNNSSLGMVRELQKQKYCGRFSQVCLESNPDFQKICEAYDIKSEKISSNGEVRDALGRMLANEEPYFLECIVHPDEPTL